MYSWSVIGEAFRSTGLVEPKKAKGHKSRLSVTWPHPPLMLREPLRFQGLLVENAWHWAPKNLDVADILNVFEEYVDGFLVSGTYESSEAREFLKRELRFHEDIVKFFVPNPDPAEHIALILWVARNLGGDLRFDNKDLTLTHEGMTVGVKDGKILSLYPSSCLDFWEVDWEKVYYEPRGKGWSSNRIMNWLGNRFRNDYAALLLLRFVRATTEKFGPFFYQVFGKGDDAVITNYSMKLLRQQAKRIMNAKNPVAMAMRAIESSASRIQIEYALRKEIQELRDNDNHMTRAALAEKLLDLQESLIKNQL